MKSDYFGGLNWSLFFREKPAFSTGEEVLVCHIEGNWIHIDSFSEEVGYYPYSKISIQGKKLFIDYGVITAYFRSEEIYPLLNSWIYEELSKDETAPCQYFGGEYVGNDERDSFFEVKRFIEDSYRYPDNDALREHHIKTIQGLKEGPQSVEKAPQIEEIVLKGETPLREDNSRYIGIFRTFVESGDLTEHKYCFTINKNNKQKKGKPSEFVEVYAKKLKKDKTEYIPPKFFDKYIWKNERERYSDEYFYRNFGSIINGQSSI